MGLAINATIVDPFLTGLGFYTVNLVRALSHLCAPLLVYTAHPPAFPRDGCDVSPVSRSLGPAYGKGAHLRRLLWAQFVLPKLMVRDNARVLLSPIPEGVIGGAIPQYIVVHDVTPLHFPREYRLQWRYFQWYVKPLLRRVVRVIAVSEYTRSEVIRVLNVPPSRVQVIPGGCDHDIFRRDIDPMTVKAKYQLDAYVLYVGNLHPHKNLVRLLQAFRRLLAAEHRCQLVIAGKKDPRYFPALQSMAEKLGLTAHVRFLGYVPSEDLPGLYAGARLFVLPSLCEGFGLPLVEAMACGVPVVAASTGAMPEVVGEAGLLVDPLQPDDLADAMHSLLTNSEWSARLSQLGLQRAQQYSWQSTAARMARVLHESLE